MPEENPNGKPEVKEPPATAPVQVPTAGPAETVAEMSKRIENLEADRLARKTSELLEIEKRLDEKMAAFKKFIDDTEVHGRSLASGLPPQKTEDEVRIDQARKLLEGTGLDPFK